MIRCFISIVLLIALGCTDRQSIKQIEAPPKSEDLRTTWSYEYAKKYNQSQFDEALWDIEMLKSELDYVDDDPWPTQAPITKIPFPVAHYGPGYQGYAAKGLSVEIDNKTIKGGSFAVSTNINSIEPKHNPDKSNIIFFNILVLTDQPDSENVSLNVSSRNYPHHTCQGRMTTSIGNVDWFAMHLASGVKFATVNTKYFNLEFGQTILVAPQSDGSLRFKQVRLPTLATDEIDEQIIQLSQQDTIMEFFKNPSNI